MTTVANGLLPPWGEAPTETLLVPILGVSPLVMQRFGREAQREMLEGCGRHSRQKTVQDLWRENVWWIPPGETRKVTA